MDPLHGVAPGDMFLSIAKALARRREPVCHAPAGPVGHATVERLCITFGPIPILRIRPTNPQLFGLNKLRSLPVDKSRGFAL